MANVHDYLEHYLTLGMDENTRAQLAAEAIAQFLAIRDGLTRQVGSDISNTTIEVTAATLTAAVIAATWKKTV